MNYDEQEEKDSESPPGGQEEEEQEAINKIHKFIIRPNDGTNKSMDIINI